MRLKVKAIDWETLVINGTRVKRAGCSCSRGIFFYKRYVVKLNCDNQNEMELASWENMDPSIRRWFAQPIEAGVVTLPEGEEPHRYMVRRTYIVQRRIFFRPEDNPAWPFDYTPEQRATYAEVKRMLERVGAGWDASGEFRQYKLDINGRVRIHDYVGDRHEMDPVSLYNVNYYTPRFKEAA